MFFLRPRARVISKQPWKYEIYIPSRGHVIEYKGSYTHTTSVDTLLANPRVHVLLPTVHRSAFPEATF